MLGREVVHRDGAAGGCGSSSRVARHCRTGAAVGQSWSRCPRISRAHAAASRTIWPPQNDRTVQPAAWTASRLALSDARRSGVWWFSHPSQKTATFCSGQAKSMMVTGRGLPSAEPRSPQAYWAWPRGACASMRAMARRRSMGDRGRPANPSENAGTRVPSTAGALMNRRRMPGDAFGVVGEGVADVVDVHQVALGLVGDQLPHP